MIARLALLLATVLLCGAAVDPGDPFRAAAIDERPGAQVPIDLRFRDAAGRIVRLRDIAAGRPILLTPVQHHCPNICGVTLTGLTQAIDGQQRWRPNRNIAIVAFGIDPREGPAEARDDLARFAAQRPAAAWRPAALTGSADNIRQVTQALGYRYAWDSRIAQYAHLSATAVLTPTGKLSSWLYGIRPSPAEVDAALAQAAADRTGGLMEQIALLCFHYDPQTGRYSLAITKAVRIAGLLTVLGMALLIALLGRRRRVAT